MSPEEFRKKYVSDLSSAIKLDSQQITALNAVLDRTHDEFDKLNDQGEGRARCLEREVAAGTRSHS